MQPGGQVFGDRYELLSLLASGGMGQVWRARDLLLDRPVAVKVLRSEFTGDPSFLARFRSEARLTARLTHPNIATLFDYGEARTTAGEHLAYLVMELVEGEPLSAVLAREGRLTVDRTLEVIRQTAAGLAAAHASGVVHRDIKPANLLVRSDGIVKITDFGIAWSTSSVPLTRTGQVMGTAHYLSPEQVQGAKAGPAADVYAVGLVAYECLSGRRAFDGESLAQIALRQVQEPPPPLPAEVPEAVRGLLERALAKDPADRFPDGAALCHAVDQVRGGGALPPRERTATAVLSTRVLPASVGPAAPASAVAPARRLMSGRRALLALLAVVGLVAVVVGLLQGVGGPAEGTPEGTTPPPAVQVIADDHVGRRVADVEADLTGLGLQVQLRPIATADVPDGEVLAVEPTGDLQPGQVVTVTHAVAPPAPAPVDGGGSGEEGDGHNGDGHNGDGHDGDGDGGNGGGNGDGHGEGGGDGKEEKEDKDEHKDE
ncbi:MAG TPA: serine/threonine-protein kinase [Geodermatophilus sp.]|nr:serine/threonine-protein kinase [Geodermatophilus sp.]